METTKKGKPKAKGNGQGTIYKMSNSKFLVMIKFLKWLDL